jgi:hypothetical protein
VVIAKFSKSIAITVAIFEILLSIILINVVFHPPSWSPHYGQPLGLKDYAMLALSPLVAFTGASILYEVIFQHSRAIWCDRNSVRYLDTYWNTGTKTVPINGIISVYVGVIRESYFSIFDKEAIVLEIKGGELKKVRTWFLSEPAATIVLRLEENLKQASRNC